MRLLHTSDWHLGHTLHGEAREHEHDLFLQWLLDRIEEHQVDALLITGDIFDTANPSSQAQAMWYGFLAQARQRFPQVSLVAIGGNHDSASRLEAPQGFFQALRMHVVGGALRNPDKSIDLDKTLVRIVDRSGTTAAWVVAVPFLRASDLPAYPDTDETVDSLIEGVRSLYREILEVARKRRAPNEALIILGHCYMVDGCLSERSERKILGGHLHPLPVDIFPDDAAYVALGHLHLAQSVGDKTHIRYSGSPIPLSMAEASYPHQVCLVGLEANRCTSVQALRIPRAVEMTRVPKEGALPLAQVVQELEQLAPAETLIESKRPYLEVCVALEGPEPGLRRKVEQALEGKAVRLVQLSVSYTGHGQTLAEAIPVTHLRDLLPEEVFLARYRRDYQEPLAPELLAAFHELMENVTGCR